MTMTHILSFTKLDDLTHSAAIYQAAGYKTVQNGPVQIVHSVINGNPSYWQVAADQKGYILIATMDPIAGPS